MTEIIHVPTMSNKRINLYEYSQFKGQLTVGIIRRQFAYFFSTGVMNLGLKTCDALDTCITYITFFSDLFLTAEVLNGDTVHQVHNHKSGCTRYSPVVTCIGTWVPLLTRLILSISYVCVHTARPPSSSSQKVHLGENASSYPSLRRHRETLAPTSPRSFLTLPSHSLQLRHTDGQWPAFSPLFASRLGSTTGPLSAGTPFSFAGGRSTCQRWWMGSNEVLPGDWYIGNPRCCGGVW
jgi:hypothetical protein